MTTDTTTVDVKSYILKVAEEQGADKETALKIAQKCYDEMPMWRPFGGATTFAEVDAHKATQEMAMHMEQETYTLRSIIDNIVSDKEMDSDQKATAISQAANEFQSRMKSMKMDNKSLWSKVKSILLGDKKSSYMNEDDEEDDEDEDEDEKSFGEKKDYSTEQRREMAKRGHARPDGSYPIADKADLMNAIRSWGRGGATAADKAHIIKRARALGATDMLPEDWSGSTKKKELETEEKTIRHEGGKWVVYSKDGSRKFGSYDSEEAAKKRLAQIERFKDDGKAVAFKVFEDSEGKLRWVTFSSNAFEDREKELFATKALEEAVEYADKEDERGPLLIFHVPPAEIGHCDFQAVQGRFLVESGTFADTPLGQKAAEYFANSDEEYQVSIGYEYYGGDEQDGVYDWLRIKERSVCPAGTAANSWTSFQLVGSKELDERKKAALYKIVGEELAEGIISKADEATKELEGTVKFKEMSENMDDKVKSLYETVKKMPQDEIRKELEAQLIQLNGGKALEEEKKEEGVAETPASETPQVDFTGLATALTNIQAQLGELAGLKETITGIQAEVKELKKSDDEKIADAMKSKVAVVRPTESEDNVLDAAKEFVNGLKDESASENPAQKYVNDWLRANRVSVET